MILDRYTLDLRSPWTRQMDKIGDTAIESIKDALGMDTLLDTRRRAIRAMGTDTWPGTVMAPVFQSIQDDVHVSTDLLVMINVSRDTRTSGITWKVHFTVFGDKILYPRQLLRIRRALEQFVQERPHLSNLVITPDTDDIKVDLTAQIGQIVEPE